MSLCTTPWSAYSLLRLHESAHSHHTPCNTTFALPTERLSSAAHQMCTQNDSWRQPQAEKGRDALKPPTCTAKWRSAARIQMKKGRKTKRQELIEEQRVRGS